MKTILITGCSSGYGLETAKFFHTQGWHVIAAMRTPREDLLPRSPRMQVLPLDVTRPDRSTVHSRVSPPRVWRANMMYRPFGAQDGPSSK